MKVLMLSGKQGSGKTTLANRLKELDTDHVYYHLKFAQPLYEMHDAVLEVFHRYMPSRGLMKDGPLLQVLGTEWGRETIDENIWANILRARIDKLAGKEGLIIVDDCRFENEFNVLPDALRIRLVAHHDVRKSRCSMWRQNEYHPSEIALDNYSNSNKFDLYLKTDTDSIAECVSKIVLALNKNIWMDLRK